MIRRGARLELGLPSLRACDQSCPLISKMGASIGASMPETDDCHFPSIAVKRAENLGYTLVSPESTNQVPDNLCCHQSYAPYDEGSYHFCLLKLR